ncbi:U6 snRNA-associated Sm-like protein LSm1 [Hetaerina americana]|uniref:U6 snRNA-associated Sm-like protein LSm1 n=1 Tax=Hetaerina americana TaxID=62018 RepID=UPI003A7F5FA4
MDTFIEAASLIGDVDKKLMVLLRDGRVLIGILRTVDQFANLVLHRTNERIHVGKEYGDINRGVIVVRGENVVLYGVVDKEMENNLPFKKVSVDEILDAQRKELEAKKEKDTLRAKALKERDLSHDDFF